MGFKERDVADLLTLYRVDDQEREKLLALAWQANTHGWWHQYGEDALPGWFQTYVGLEQDAVIIRVYEVQSSPSAPTEDYARAVILLGDDEVAADDLEHRVGLRLQRQELLTSPQPHSAVYLDKTSDVDCYRAVMNRRCAEAETPADSIALLNRIIGEL